jgi:putative MATE family efflux protein
MAFLIIGFSWGATAGLAIPVARRFGAGDIQGVKSAIVASGVVAALMAATITAIGLIFGYELLRMVNTPDSLMEMAGAYQQVMFATAALTIAYNWLAAVIRALGDSRTPLIFLIISSLLNVVITYAFVGSFGWGVASTAGATGIAQAISVVACLVYARKKMPQMFPDRAAVRSGLAELAVPARIGLPMGFQMSVIGIGTVVLQSGINALGADAVAAATVASRLEGLAMSPLNTFGVAMVTFVAQNYGAKEYKRIRIGVFRMSIVATVVAFTLGFLQYRFTYQLVGMFTTEASPTTIDMVATRLQISAFMYFALGIMFVVRNTVQGLGATAIPTASGFLELGLRAGAGVVLGGAFGWLGLAWGNPLAWAGACLLCSISWFSNRRKLVALEREQGAGMGTSAELGAGFITDELLADLTTQSDNALETNRERELAFA